MRPALSIIVFTTLAGAAQGMAVVVALATLLGHAPAALELMLWTATGMLVLALVASFFHLGHPLRAWRAVLMWRTSWMSREVIALPGFIALMGAWAWLANAPAPDTTVARVIACLVLAGAFVLWYCTAMIYACIRFIQEWAHPLTIVNYVMLGLASGLVMAGALAVIAGDRTFASAIGAFAPPVILLAWFTRALSLRRNAQLRPKSTTQSATGIRSTRVVQKSMGFTAGSFNTREFFHGASRSAMRMARVGFQVFTFAVPLVLLAWGQVSGSSFAWAMAAVSQAAGLLAERWFFFAQANHPQNIYYQTIS
jgi:DMSO reductase anchor subunit